MSKQALCITLKDFAAKFDIPDDPAQAFLLGNLTPELRAKGLELLLAQPMMFNDRADCETDESLLQVIPICVFQYMAGHVLTPPSISGVTTQRYKSDEPNLSSGSPPPSVPRRSPTIFSYYRGKAQGEGRLHGLLSISVGGHIEPTDMEQPEYSKDPRGAYYACMKREMTEEVQVATPWTTSFLGLIYDRSSPVGRVHLGCVNLIDTHAPNVYALESSMEQPAFRSLSDLEAHHPETLEPWCKILLPILRSIP